MILPREGNADVSTRLKRLHQHEHLQVGWPLDVGMRLRSGVLFDDADALLEKVAENSDAILLRDVHGLLLVVF